VGAWLLMLLLGGCGSSGTSFNSDAGDAGTHGGKLDATRGLPDAFRLTSGDTGVQRGTLSISPQNPTLEVTNAAAPSQAFTARFDLDGTTKDVTATWNLSSFALGPISSAGKFSPQGDVAGTVEVIATYGNLVAKTKVTVTVAISSNLTDVTLPDGTVISNDSTAITPADMTALNGTPKATVGDAASGPRLLYPYDHTVFPLGLLAPVAEFSGGAVTPVDFKISLDTPGFHWNGFGHVGNPSALQAAVPQAAWDAALRTATGVTPPAGVTMSVVTAAAGVAYGPATSSLVIANGQLTGIIYFESYSTDAIPDAGADATDFGLWAVKPGQTKPPSHIEPGCVICHGVSAAGNTLTNGTDDSTIGGLTGVFRVEADGGYTHLATAPTIFPYTIAGAVDSRGIGWGSVSPDGKVILRGENQFWGGEALTAWLTPPEPLMVGGVLQPLSTSMTVSGDFNMYVPEYSPDGTHLVYVTAPNAADAGPPGSPSQSIGMVDIATELGDGGGAKGFGSVSLSNARLLYDSTTAAPDGGGGGTLTKVPTFLPDSETIVFEETLGGLATAATAGYNGMLPDWTGVDGELAILQKTKAGKYVRTALKNANASVDPDGPTHNFEPKPLPVSVGGYYWVVYASLRTDAYPLLSTGGSTPKKLWVTAISPGTAAGTDPSHPPFTLINQAIVSPQRSQRAYWALAPCLATGASCQSGSDCCNGSCIPDSSSDPSSPLVCKLPTMPANACTNLGGRCTAGENGQCCNSAAGVMCIGTLNGYGTCVAPGAPP
jgi:hypothetical protein